MLKYAAMLDFEDKRWPELSGGYRMPIDIRPLLLRLRAGRDAESVWSELWEELHHQGDVGLASYAAIPHLVKTYREQGQIDWNTYAIVAAIELARTESNNPVLPDWLEVSYFEALNDLAELGTTEILKSNEEDVLRAILSVLATVRGLRTYGKLLSDYSEAELENMEEISQLL